MLYEVITLRLVGAHEVLGDILAREGLYGSLRPTPEDETDIARGIDVAKGLGALDVGQGAVVQQGMVLAVEGVVITSYSIHYTKLYDASRSALAPALRLYPDARSCRRGRNNFV